MVEFKETDFLDLKPVQPRLSLGTARAGEFKEDRDLKNLGQYYGTNQYFEMYKYLITDGIKYIIENGYHWFVSDALIYCKAHLRNEEFLTIKLKIIEDKKAEIIITDGNTKEFWKRRYEYTDAKRDLKLFLTDNVLMLNSEY